MFIPVRNVVWAMAGVLVAFSVVPASADYVGSRDWFNARTEADQRSLQGLMVLLGHYEGRIDGAFGRLTHDALVKYELSRGFNGDGILNAEEERQLTVDALAVYAQFGFGTDLTVDDATGIALPLAERVFVSHLETPNGTRWESADGRLSLETLAIPEVPFEVLYRSLRAGEVVYETLDPKFFVVSGREGGQEYYTSFRSRKGGSVGFWLTWDEPLHPVGSVLAAFLYSTVQYPPSLRRSARGSAVPLPVREVPDVVLSDGAAAGLQIAVDAQIVIGACPELTLNMDVLDAALEDFSLTAADAFDRNGRHQEALDALVRTTVGEIVDAGLTQADVCGIYLERYGPEAAWPNPAGLVQPRTG